MTILQHKWRLILSAALGFTLGGLSTSLYWLKANGSALELRQCAQIDYHLRTLGQIGEGRIHEALDEQEESLNSALYTLAVLNSGKKIPLSQRGTIQRVMKYRREHPHPMRLAGADAKIEQLFRASS